MGKRTGLQKFPTPISNPLAPKKPSDSSALNDFEQEEATDPQLSRSESPSPVILVPAAEALSPQSLKAAQKIPSKAPQRMSQKMPEMSILNSFMQDPHITEIMVNDLRNIILEKEGKLFSTEVSFESLEELNRVVRNILDITGRILSPEQPYVDTSLPDGSRVNIIISPLTVSGPCITIRKFPMQKLSIHDLMKAMTLDQKIAYFLNACVLGRMNILICGGTGSGKTTLLNVLSSFIPKTERIITIEDVPELSIQHVNSVQLQTKPQTPTSAAVSARELVVNSLRMRPDRIIIGECRRAEAFDMLQAMNTGHAGSMTTLHANSARDGLARLETLCMMSEAHLPTLAIRKQIESALDVIIQIRRFRNGKRKVVSVTEITGMEGEVFTLQDIFVFEGKDGEGRFKTTGFVPACLDRLREEGVDLPDQYFV